MVEVRIERRRLRFFVISAMGHNYVFWPVVAFCGVLGSGPARWPSPLLWLAGLLTCPIVGLIFWKRASKQLRTGSVQR